MIDCESITASHLRGGTHIYLIAYFSHHAVCYLPIRQELRIYQSKSSLLSALDFEPIADYMQDACWLPNFELHRTKDVSGCSGTGIVAFGVTFPNGPSVLEWRAAPFSVNTYQHIDDIVSIHGHDGATTLIHERRLR